MNPSTKNLSFKWCLIIGGFGFLAGFLGPLIYAPEANQGPLLGILITGPLGVILGGLCWSLSRIFRWTYGFQLRVAVGCCILIAGGLIWFARQPKPEWPGTIYEIQVTKCSPASETGESVLETIVVHEWQIKKEGDAYSSGAITYATPTVVRKSFYITGACPGFPVGYTGKYYVSHHPARVRDEAVLEDIPEFAKGL